MKITPWVAGFLTGAAADGCIYTRNRGEYILEIEQKSREWLEYIRDVTGIKTRIHRRKNGYYRLRIYSKTLFRLVRIVYHSPFILQYACRDFQRGFVRGIVDAEGSIHKNRAHLQIFSFKGIALCVEGSYQGIWGSFLNFYCNKKQRKKHICTFYLLKKKLRALL